MNRVLKMAAVVLVALPWLCPEFVAAQAGAILTVGSGTGQTTLSWVPATTYTDGSALTLANQRVYYSVVSGACNNLPNGGAVECLSAGDVSPALSGSVVTGLLNGTYFFWVTQLDAVGVESMASNEASWTVDIPGNVLTPSPATGLTAGP